MADRLTGKVAVVTGAGRGIGRGIALALASEDAAVVVNDLGSAVDGAGASANIADEVVKEIEKAGHRAVANYDSVADSGGAGNIVKAAIDNFGKIDILVNNAGIIRDRMIWNMTDEEWDIVVKVHLYGNFYCTRAASIYMRDAVKAGKQSAGRIINLTSGTGIRGSATQPNYGSAKMGVVGMTYSCAMALGRYNVTCNAIVPRASTRMTDTATEEQWRINAVRKAGMSPEEAKTANIDEIKQKILGAPEAVGPLACWLAGDAAQHVNGQVFQIMGGQTSARVSVFKPMTEYQFAFGRSMFSVDDMWDIMPDLTADLPDLAKEGN